MESLHNKIERENFLAEIITEITESKKVNAPQFVEGIVVDENHQLSEDAKFGHELAKNPIKWYEYFNGK